MSYTQESSEVRPAEPPSTGELPRTGAQTSNVGPSGPLGNSQPRIVEEHHVAGPRGEDEIEAVDDRGRRWYHLRPEPRGRADLMGFNYTWWAVLWIVVIVSLFFPWWY
jgi:hypothetical protein